MKEHYPYDVFNANAPGGWKPRANPKRAVADNVDPYHDKFGRFTTKDGAATPRGADGPDPKDWRDKNKSAFIAQTQSDSVLPSSDPGLTEIEPGPLTVRKLLRHYLDEDHYPTFPTPGKTTVFRFIGDDVADIPKTSPNSCTVRLSYALNRAGLPIRPDTGLTLSGADNMLYFPRAKDLDAYLRQNLPMKPRVLTPKLHWQRELWGEHGIIEFEGRPGAMGDATGHFTLYDGFTNVDGPHHDYWAQSKHIYFWPLPYD